MDLSSPARYLANLAAQSHCLCDWPATVVVVVVVVVTQAALGDADWPLWLAWSVYFYLASDMMQQQPAGRLRQPAESICAGQLRLRAKVTL